MRALIIDDEAPARQALRRLLASQPDLEIVGEAANALEALDFLSNHPVDLLLLDIEMPGLSGFDLLAQLPSPPLTVFVTAYDAYAVRAFEANAVDYLLKPAEPAAIERALSRCRARLSSSSPPLDPALLRKLQLSLAPNAPAKIAARRARRFVLVPRREILYIHAEDKLVFLVTANEKLLTDRTIGELEELLPASEFLRIHRSTLVNLDAVTELYPWMDNGAWRVRLKDGRELDVSRDRVKPLKEHLAL